MDRKPYVPPKAEIIPRLLTFEGNFCDIAMCRAAVCPHGGSCSQKEVWERLKQYEDTGLAPDDIPIIDPVKWGKDAAKATVEGVEKFYNEMYGISSARLHEIIEAEHQGRLKIVEVT